MAALRESRGSRWWSFTFAAREPMHGAQPLDAVRLGCVELEAEFVRFVHLKTHSYGWKKVAAHYNCTRSSWDRLRHVMLVMKRSRQP